MQVPDFVTVIPFDDEALRVVTTPFVAFEQPFESRAGRFERQKEVMFCNSPVVVLTDTWPDAHHDALNWSRGQEILKLYGQPQPRFTPCMWPESAMYVTDIAKMFKIDERIRYRPPMWFFSQYFEQCVDLQNEPKRNDDDAEISPDAGIRVYDRNIYPVEYPKLKLAPVETDLTVIVIYDWDDSAMLDPKSVPKGAEILIAKCRPMWINADIGRIFDCSGMPVGAAFNRLVQLAHGKRIAVHRPSARSNDRWNRQLKDDADLSLSTIQLDRDAIEGWGMYSFTHVVDKPTRQLGTMMFSRKALERHAAHPDMPDGFDYDLYLRMMLDEELEVVYHETPLVHDRKNLCPYGRQYTQQVYNDAANRLRYGKAFHAWSYRTGPVDEQLPSAERFSGR